MRKRTFYERYIKRMLDIVISFCALVVLSPVLLILIIAGTVAMRGNPFFVQLRPGKKGKDGHEIIFKLVKFRSMSDIKDKDGNLLPDAERLNKYGRFLRITSLDELPELFNIFIGNMSLVGPRPLAVQYLPFYTQEERRRHDVSPGLTGLAQVNGRNAVNWPERFAYDLEYIDHISFKTDLKIICKTALKVLKHSGISVRATGEIMDFDKFRATENSEKQEKHYETVPVK